MSYKVTKESTSKRELGRSEKDKSAFQTFEDLEVYQVAREFRKAIYAVTHSLPEFEKYDLASQIRRVAVSLTNNIAEGHGCFHYPDQIRFILHSRGSLQELVDDLNVCSDENYVSADEVGRLKEQASGVLILINGYLRYLRSRSSSVQESDGSYSATTDLFDDLPL